MKRPLLRLLLAVSFVCGSLYAVEPQKAAGGVSVDGSRIDLKYAYAIDHQANEVTHRKDDRRVVLTDKPLPDDIKLSDIDNSFPDGTFGLVVCVGHSDKVTHVLLQHAKGMYDAGYFEEDPSYTFKPLKGDQGTIAGNLSSRKVKTNTMSFSFDVDFNAPVK
jgi:hypothetical protein